MRRPLLVGALGAAVIALVASGAVAVSTLGEPSGPTMMGGQGQRSGTGMMGAATPGSDMMGSSADARGSGKMGSGMMGSADGMGMVWSPGNGVR